MEGGLDRVPELRLWVPPGTSAPCSRPEAGPTAVWPLHHQGEAESHLAARGSREPE